ncbi:metal-dependent hydrolase [Novosphingobium sp.]|uniref:metal-dependent hydrolase n=1 Tax=Novosphingobium sp. TaxID=1874826 RepID=UPI00286DE5AB|nr:metal-dependent hydrolase [Novosphingobium sp.]
MDNLTHSLIGAALGQAGLKRKTGLAMPALIIAANLPDIDAPCALYGVESLAMRRGITHGPIALVLLPLVLAGLLIAFDRWQARRGTRPEKRLPVHAGWLVALCYIGILTHPFFDWLNSYGIRLLEPFSHRWFYGDALFIVDPWILAMLGAGIWLSRRRERAQKPKASAPARVGAYGVMAYVGVNLAITWDLAPQPISYVEKTVANPVPIAFWKRDRLTRTVENERGSQIVSISGDQGQVSDFGPINMSDPRIAEWSKNDPAAKAFLFWSRMPVAELHDDHITLRDQRFLGSPASGQFTVTLRKPKP